MPRPTDFLPLHPLEFDVLMALLDKPRHGYEIVKAIESSSPLTAIYPANLYRRIRDLAASGLVQEVSAPPGSTDLRRRYLSATNLGRRVAKAEAERLTNLIADQRVQRLLYGGRSG